MMRAVADDVGWDTSKLFAAIAARYGIRQLGPADRAWLDSALRLTSSASDLIE